MTAPSARQVGVTPKLVLGGVVVFVLTNIIACLFAAFVVAPQLREVRATEAAVTLECREQAAQQYREGDLSFDELDRELSDCGGYPLR